MMVLIAHISMIISTGNDILLIFNKPRMQHYVLTIITLILRYQSWHLSYAADICKITKEKHQTLLSKYQLFNLSLHTKIVAFKSRRAILNYQGLAHPSLGSIQYH